MDSFSFVGAFQERRRRLLLAILLVVALSIGLGAISYGLLGTGAALGAGAMSLVVGLWLSARWARRAYRCPRCQKIPMKVEVRVWTKYTRYLRWLQVSKRFTAYPPWAVLFIDFNTRRCPACGIALGKGRGEFVSAT